MAFVLGHRPWGLGASALGPRGLVAIEALGLWRWLVWHWRSGVCGLGLVCVLHGSVHCRLLWLRCGLVRSALALVCCVAIVRERTFLGLLLRVTVS